MRPVAILTSDWHLSHKPPAGRDVDLGGWYDVMETHVLEVMAAAEANSNVPVIVAGDVFHTWNEPAELVSAVAEWLGRYSQVPVYMIPGQHDLPFHDPFQFNRSALHNLHLAARGFRAGRWDEPVAILEAHEPTALPENWTAHAAWWGDDWWMKNPSTEARTLLVAHKYIHDGQSSTTSYPGAKTEDDVTRPGALRVAAAGFQVSLFGDNHCPFMTGSDDGPVYNHGCLIRRKRDERKYMPEYGVLCSDGSIQRVPLKSSESDTWHHNYLVQELDEVPAFDASSFTESVKSLNQDQTIDFRAACNALLGQSDLSVGAKREILDLLDKEKK